MRQTELLSSIEFVTGRKVTAIDWEYVLGEELSPYSSDEFFVTIILRIEIDGLEDIQASVTGVTPYGHLDYNSINIDDAQVRVYIPSEVSSMVNGSYGAINDLVDLAMEYTETWAVKADKDEAELVETVSLSQVRGEVC